MIGEPCRCCDGSVFTLPGVCEIGRVSAFKSDLHETMSVVSFHGIILSGQLGTVLAVGIDYLVITIRYYVNILEEYICCLEVSLNTW